MIPERLAGEYIGVGHTTFRFLRNIGADAARIGECDHGSAVLVDAGRGQLGISETSGVLVISTLPGGPAAKAGLRGSGQADASDDIITAIDGHTIGTIDQLTQYLDTKKVGDRVTLSVTRNGQHISIGVTLGNFQAQPSTTP